MDAIENAIRKAFEKGDARDRTFREKVYRSAFTALERSLESNAEMPEDAKRARRIALKAKITEIETEFMPARAPAAQAPQRAATPTRQAPEQAGRATPQAAARQASPSSDFTPSVERDERRAVARTPEQKTSKRRREKAPRQRRRHPFAMLYLIATLAAFIGVGIWWSLSSGIFLSDAERDTSVRNPPMQLQEEDYSTGETDGQTGSGSRATGQWLAIFTPTDPTTVAAPGNASAEVVQDDGRPALRIASDRDSGIVFDVGQGVLEALAGKNAIFSLDVASQDGQETQISISCHFGSLGSCGRKRYVVGPSRTEFLFEVEMPSGNPGSGGTIAIVPDVEGKRRALDVYGIRTATAE
ncbi:hypothetical protein [Nitratireductor indicus]|uniref:hypothetical protein n=1 Tax=Nitratireductor indicus TaxID=721133 RepID=UPI0028759F5E|nr:hypothetical protein [Nitratireductor indicus]MDS1137399.1 hypothetical protein [Nitratireductor indicus]